MKAFISFFAISIFFAAILLFFSHFIYFAVSFPTIHSYKFQNEVEKRSKANYIKSIEWAKIAKQTDKTFCICRWRTRWSGAWPASPAGSGTPTASTWCTARLQQQQQHQLKQKHQQKNKQKQQQQLKQKQQLKQQQQPLNSHYNSSNNNK